MAVSFALKAGATFLLHAVCCQDDGTAIDLTGAMITAELRGAFGSVAGVLGVTMTDAPNGLFNLSASGAATATWPVGRLVWDVCFVQDATVIYSDTATMVVSAPQTPPPGASP